MEQLYDAAIIGGGPAGIAVAYTFQQAGLNYVALEKGPLANHVSQYPTFMQFLSTRDLLELDGFPLTITEDKPDRRQYLAYLARFVRERRLNIRTQVEALTARPRADGTFTLDCREQSGAPLPLAARSVVVACGAYENPRMLNVPGEELPKVSHFFKEAHPYVNRKVLVVGGRNSAIEVALHLWRAGADVSLSYHKYAMQGFDVKYWLKPDIENRLKNDEIHPYLGTRAERIDWKSVTLRDLDGGQIVIENDLVLLLTGYDPPVKFLTEMGIELEAETNIPRHDPQTLETNVPGLFVAGTITAGNVSGHVFIENSRRHGELILRRLREILGNGSQSNSGNKSTSLEK